MSEVRSLARLLLVLIASFLILTCAQSNNRPANLAGGNPCASGGGLDDREAPIVCIDDSNTKLTVNPDPVKVWHQNRGGAPVTIQWYTKSGASFSFRWKKTTCVTKEHCPTAGHCTAKTLSTATGETCKYDVVVPGHPDLDPDVVVSGCCS